MVAEEPERRGSAPPYRSYASSSLRAVKISSFGLPLSSLFKIAIAFLMHGVPLTPPQQLFYSLRTGCGSVSGVGGGTHTSGVIATTLSAVSSYLGPALSLRAHSSLTEQGGQDGWKE